MLMGGKERQREETVPSKAREWRPEPDHPSAKYHLLLTRPDLRRQPVKNLLLLSSISQRCVSFTRAPRVLSASHARAIMQTRASDPNFGVRLPRCTMHLHVHHVESFESISAVQQVTACTYISYSHWNTSWKWSWKNNERHWGGLKWPSSVMYLHIRQNWIRPRYSRPPREEIANFSACALESHRSGNARYDARLNCDFFTVGRRDISCIAMWSPISRELRIFRLQFNDLSWRDNEYNQLFWQIFVRSLYNLHAGRHFKASQMSSSESQDY